MNSFKVEFIGGPLNGAVRYYLSLRIARSVARRYVNKSISGSIFSTSCCEIYYIDSRYHSCFIEVVL